MFQQQLRIFPEKDLDVAPTNDPGGVFHRVFPAARNELTRQYKLEMTSKVGSKRRKHKKGTTSVHDRCEYRITKHGSINS